MRVTNSIVRENLLRNVMADTGRLAEAQMQLATGRRFQDVSDDPVASRTAIRADSRIRALDQYQRNITAARTRTTAEESVLDQVGELLTRAKELALSQSSSDANSQTRALAAGEVQQILSQVVHLGNSKVGDEYLFGGNLIADPPFDADGNYLGDDGRRQARIGAGYVIDSNHSGGSLLVDSGVVGALTELRDQLRAGSQSGVTLSLDSLDDAFRNTQTLLAEVGGLERQYDLASQNIEALDVNLQTVRRDATEIGLDEATINFVSLQTSLQAAMASANRILSVNLTEYLR